MPRRPHPYPFGRRHGKEESGSAPNANAEEASHAGEASPAPAPTPAPSQPRRQQTSSSEASVVQHLTARNRTSSNKIPPKTNKHEGLTQQYYRRYELSWENLRGWLEEKFPTIEFEKQCDVRGEDYVFYVPRKLTDAEKDSIFKLRDDYRE